MILEERKKTSRVQPKKGDRAKRRRKPIQIKKTFTYFLAGYHFFFSSFAYGGGLEIISSSGTEPRRLSKAVTFLEETETAKNGLSSSAKATSPYLSQEPEGNHPSWFYRLRKGWESFQQNVETHISYFAETSSILDGFCSWMGSVAKTLPPSLYAKTPFEINYAQDEVFWQAHFASEIEDLQQSPLSPSQIQDRLKELQEIVWHGLLSPYVYEVALKDLNEQRADFLPLLEEAQDQFQEKLKARPALLKDNFQRDLLTSLEWILHSDRGEEKFEDLLTYYQQLQDPLEYTHSVVGFRRFIQQNQKALNLTNLQYQALSKATIKAINQRDKKKYRHLKAQQQSMKSTLQALPYYEGNLFEDVFNSALPSLAKEKLDTKEETHSDSFSILNPLKGLTHLAYKGLKYVTEHPAQAITIGLASQVAAAAAIKAFSAPGSLNGRKEDSANKNEFQQDKQSSHFEQSSRSRQPRYVTRTIEEEFQANTYLNGEQSGSSIAGLSNGDFVITWESYNQTGDAYYDIYGQRFSNNGTRLGNEFQVNTITSNDQRLPTIAALNNGDFVIAWHSYGQDGSNNGVYGQRYANNGTRLDNEFQVNTYTNDNQSGASVAGLNNGDFVVAWQSHSQDGSGFGIYGQRFANNGTRLGSEFQANTYTGDWQVYPSLIGLKSGDFVVTWSSTGQDGSGAGIFGQRYNNNGTSLGSEFQISTYTYGDQVSSSIAGLDNGDFIVTWHSDYQDNGGVGIYGQRFASNGTRLGGEFQVNTYTNGTQIFSSTAGLKYGDFIMAWQSDGQDGSGYGIYGQRYANNGARLGNEFQVNTYSANDQGWASVAGLSNGDFVVTWQSFNQTGSGYDIFGKVFGSSFVGTTGSVSTTGISSSPSTTGGLSNTSAGSATTERVAGTTGTEVSTSSLTGTATTNTPSSSAMASSTSTPTGGLSSATASSAASSLTSLGITSTTTSAEIPDSGSSSAGGLPQGAIIGIAAAGGGAAVLGTCAGVGYCLYRKHASKKATGHDELELAPTFVASEPLPKHISLPREEIVSIPPSPKPSEKLLTPPSGPAKGKRIGKTHTIIESEHGRYALYNKINQEDARLLFEQTGVNVAFAPGQKKTSFTLGSGQFGKLRLARNEETKAFIGVKKIKGDAEIYNSLNEGKIQAKLSRYNHIMPLLDSVESTGSQGQKVLYQFMPLAGFGNGAFFQEKLALVKESDLKEKFLVHVAKGLLTGVANMHSAGIYHLDLKPTNFVIGKDGTLYVIDFGCALELENNDTLTEGNGDTRYFSPERFACLRQGKQEKDTGNIQRTSSFSAGAADAWAIGMTLLEIALNKYPFEDVHMAARLQKWDSAYFKKMVEKIDLLQHGASNNWIGLVKGLLAINPQERLGVKDALKWQGFREKKYQISSPEEGRQLFKALSEIKEETFQRGQSGSPSASGLTAYSESEPKERDSNYLSSSYAPSASRRK